MGKALPILEALASVARRARGCAVPERYRWHAVWWHLHGKLCKSVSAFQYSRNLLDLRRDMLCRPEHYRKRPEKYTDYQWSLKT